MRILLVEDSINLADTIKEALTKNSYDVDVVHDGVSGYAHASSGIYDIVILDLILPKQDGYEVLRNLRKNHIDVPVLILSAKSTLQDKLDGFIEGADDYVTKPFEIAELLLRIRAILRRRHNPGGDILSFGELQLDMAKCEIMNSKTQKAMQISGKEQLLLEQFLCNPKCVLSKEQITTKVWGYDSSAEYNQVEVYISFLRKKIEFLQVHVKIRTIRGAGYILEEEK